MSQAPKSRIGFSGLSLIALCFAVAALLRVGGVAESLSSAQAASHTAEKAAGQATGEPMAVAQSAVQLPPAMSDGICPSPQGNAASATSAGGAAAPEVLLAAIRQRTASLDLREKKIVEKERSLQVAGERIAAELKVLEQERVALDKAIAEARQVSVAGTEKLVKIYQSMKMDPRVAVVFLREMRGDAASLIIANMNTKKAYAITLLMAGRKIK
jgi:flagellar motility protein MotE (MotC chaperone)